LKPDLSRRQFLVHSAGVAGALGLGGHRVHAGVGPDRSLRLGFIGLGDRGRHLLNALLRWQGDSADAKIEIRALCDVHPQRLKRCLTMVRDGVPVKTRGKQQPELANPDGGRRAGSNVSVQGFTNYRELLDCRDVDIVFIATPVHLHADHAICALGAGKHVYLEKPLAGTVHDCQKLKAECQNAEAKGLTFQVGFQRRYNPRYEKSIAYLQGGELGAPLFMRAQWHATGNSPKDKPWIFRREKSGDIVVEQACHQFDIFNWVFQSVPRRVCGLGGVSRYDDQPPGRDTLDHYGLILEYPGGAKVHFSHLSFSVPERRFSGIYELAFAADGGVDLANAQAWSRDGTSRRLEAPRGNDTQLALQAFLHCVRTGQRTIANIDVAYSATMTSLLAQRALDSGRTVEWSDLGAG